MLSVQEKEARSRAREEKEFNNFMTKPETKLMLSLVPPSENPDVMQTLLRAAFKAGVNAGAGDILGDLLEAVLKKDKPSGSSL